MLDAFLESEFGEESDAIRRWGMVEGVLGVVEDDGLAFASALKGREEWRREKRKRRGGGREYVSNDHKS